MTQPPLYLIHGGPGAQGSLHGLAQALPSHLMPTEILQRYAGSVPLTVDQHIADMAEAIQQPANLLGHSWGAMLSLSFVSQYPSKCRQLILVGCGTFSQTSRAEYERRINLRTDLERKAALKKAVTEAATEAERNQAFRKYADYATSLQGYSTIVDPYSNPGTRLDPAGHSETWADAMRLQTEEIEPCRFESISCPVTLIQGREDPHPGELIYADLKPYIPQLEYIEIPQCGHEPWLELHARNEFLELVSRIVN